MSFVVDQYNSNAAQSFDFMTPLLKNGSCTRVSLQEDMGLMGSQILNSFKEEAILIDEGILSGTHYYFHAKIKKISSVQTFYIYLANCDNDGKIGDSQQYLKTVTVSPAKSGEADWMDIEFIFSPFASFNAIVFTMQRTAEDYATPRYATIVYQELSKINNLLPSLGASSLYKIGVQSRPGFLMCINGEEIRIGRNGIYELRNGFVYTTFFSAVAAAKEPDNMDEILNDIEEATSVQTVSKCIFNLAKEHNIDAFSLDYLYQVQNNVAKEE